MPVLLALSDSWSSTIAIIVVWGVAFPALVTVLIGVAAAGAMGERSENERNRRYRKK